MRYNAKRMLACFMCVTLLTGCSAKTDNPHTEEIVKEPEIITWFTGETVSIQYEVPKSRSYIMVDQWGYRENSEKKFVCEDITEETTFEVVACNTGDTVYSGTLKKTGQNQTYTGDFTKLTTPGVYHIRTEYLGESYPFTISDTVYKKQIQALVDDVKAMDWTNSLTESCRVLSTLLLAYELYPKAFAGKDSGQEIPQLLQICLEGVENILVFQNHKTGEVFLKPYQDTDGELSGSPEMTAFFLGTVAKLCYSLKEYDAVKATELLQYATLSWQFINKENATLKTDILFYAATEMYRLTGQYKYRNVIQKILPEDEMIGSEGEFDYAFFANITYLMTAAKVNVDYCNLAMETMIREATRITEESREQTYPVRTKTAESAILQDASLIVFASRVNYNQEYMTVLENHLHYLNGVNSDNKNYFSEEESWVSTSFYGKSLAILAYSLLI